MRVLLTTYGSRGDVEPLAGLAAAVRELGAQVRVCAPPDGEFEELVTGVGAEFVPFGRSVRELVTGVAPVSADDVPRFAAELVAARFDTVAAAAEGCDVVVATGLLPVGTRSVAELRGIPYVYACFHPCELPSPHYLPSAARPGPPFPPGVTDNRVLWDLDARKVDALYGDALNSHLAALGLPPVTGVRDHVFTGQPWLAADPVLGPWQDLTDLDVVQTGAWLLPDQRPLPADLSAFLEAGAPPVYVGFGSMPMRGAPDVARVAVEAVRAQGRRVVVGSGWAGLGLTDVGPVDGDRIDGDRDDCFVVGEVNQQRLFGRVAAVVHHGGAGTTTTAARAGAPQVVVPQLVDQPRWAERVAELGIGAAHDGPTPTFASLSAALTTALADETRARATTVAAMIRTDGAEVAARLLFDVVGRSPEGPVGSVASVRSA
ncbi:UDP:flavonoid glycosyltransferase YjiC, YdhE family [Streptomyces sp. yr375]|uniref:glycosyltransferase n=1 Tax=Streptomyces sp. yr375 TaxID=1761906 RepID=UPI0008AF236F|nr:glycosyltransferase [Streptomyces sp. yr375]SES39504.1 UDP:flavonoid glycosyltransferase YjiC, YdhE family [Streptomyces sp. yr375]